MVKETIFNSPSFATGNSDCEIKTTPRYFIIVNAFMRGCFGFGIALKSTKMIKLFKNY